MKIFIGKFNEKQLIAKEDKKAIDEGIKKTGLKYIENKIIFKNGKPHLMEIFLTDNF